MQGTLAMKLASLYALMMCFRQICAGNTSNACDVKVLDDTRSAPMFKQKIHH